LIGLGTCEVMASPACTISVELAMLMSRHIETMMELMANS
jgi:hypothetical protein